MKPNIILTTGIYDLLKDQIRRRRVTPSQSDLLTDQLRHARQVRRKDLPADVVDINSRVTIKFLGSGEERTHIFVQPGKARQRHGTESIMTPMGVALVGHSAGTKIKWPFNDSEEEIEILKVERF